MEDNKSMIPAGLIELDIPNKSAHFYSDVLQFCENIEDDIKMVKKELYYRSRYKEIKGGDISKLGEDKIFIINFKEQIRNQRKYSNNKDIENSTIDAEQVEDSVSDSTNDSVSDIIIENTKNKIYDNTQRSCYVVELSAYAAGFFNAYVYTDISEIAKKFQENIFDLVIGFGEYFIVYVEDEGVTTTIDMHKYVTVKPKNYPLISYDKSLQNPNFKNFTDEQTEHFKENVKRGMLECECINIGWDAANIPALKGKKLGVEEKFNFRHSTGLFKLKYDINIIQDICEGIYKHDMYAKHQ